MHTWRAREDVLQYVQAAADTVLLPTRLQGADDSQTPVSRESEGKSGQDCKVLEEVRGNGQHW